MEKMKQGEIDMASGRILGYLDAHGDAPVLGMKDDLRNPDVEFYMGLGDLILHHLVSIEERGGTFWARKPSQSGRTA